MVRSLFKSRYWWLLHDKEEVEKVNFLWTQCRQNTIMSAFKCKLMKKSDEVQAKKPKAKKLSTSQSVLVAVAATVIQGEGNQVKEKK